MLNWLPKWVWHVYNFVEKTFANGCKIVKFVEVFSLKSFPLYSTLSCTCMLYMWIIVTIIRVNIAKSNSYMYVHLWLSTKQSDRLYLRIHQSSFAKLPKFPAVQYTLNHKSCADGLAHLKPWKMCFLQTSQYCQVMNVRRTCSTYITCTYNNNYISCVLSVQSPNVLSCIKLYMYAV